MLKALKTIRIGGAVVERLPPARPIDRRARLALGRRPVIDPTAEFGGSTQKAAPSTPVPIESDPALAAAAALLEKAGYRIAPAGTTPEPVADGCGAEKDRRADQGAARLSQRERQVLELLAEGAPNKLIARRLGVSVHTAKFHVASILAKLGAANRTDAIGVAMRTGLVLI